MLHFSQKRYALRVVQCFVMKILKGITLYRLEYHLSWRAWSCRCSILWKNRVTLVFGCCKSPGYRIFSLHTCKVCWKTWCNLLDRHKAHSSLCERNTVPCSMFSCRYSTGSRHIRLLWLSWRLERQKMLKCNGCDDCWSGCVLAITKERRGCQVNVRGRVLQWFCRCC